MFSDLAQGLKLSRIVPVIKQEKDIRRATGSPAHYPLIVVLKIGDTFYQPLIGPLPFIGLMDLGQEKIRVIKENIYGLGIIIRNQLNVRDVEKLLINSILAKAPSTSDMYRPVAGSLTSC